MRTDAIAYNPNKTVMRPPEAILNQMYNIPIIEPDLAIQTTDPGFYHIQRLDNRVSMTPASDFERTLRWIESRSDVELIDYNSKIINKKPTFDYGLFGRVKEVKPAGPPQAIFWIIYAVRGPLPTGCENGAWIPNQVAVARGAEAFDKIRR